MLASGYTNLNVAVYSRWQEVHSIPNDLARFGQVTLEVETGDANPALVKE